MHFYALSYSEMMALPIKTFWFMNATIDRINAQKDMRSLNVAVCGQGGEGATDYREKLILEIGTIVKVIDDPMSAANTAHDKAGLADLKVMANETIG
jgi:hypothetical protein